MGDASVGSVRCVGKSGHDYIATSAAWQARRIKTTSTQFKTQEASDESQSSYFYETSISNDGQICTGGWSRSGESHWVGSWIWWGTSFSNGFCFGLIKEETKSLESGLQKVLFRQDRQFYQHSPWIQRHFPRRSCKGTWGTGLSFGEYALSFHGFHYKENLKPQRKLLSIILNCPFRYRAKCKFQIKVLLSTCQLKIREKREHDHTKDISKTIPVAAAKKIMETLTLAPVGQHTSKALPRTQTIVCHMGVKRKC